MLSLNLCFNITCKLEPVTILFLTFCFVGRNGNITGNTMWNM